MTYPIPIEAVSVADAIEAVARRMHPGAHGYGYARREAWRAICMAVLDGALRAYVMDALGETHAAYRPQFAGLQDRDPFDLDRLLMRAEGGDLRGRLFYFRADLEAFGAFFPTDLDAFRVGKGDGAEAQRKPLPPARDGELKAFLREHAHSNDEVAQRDAEQRFNASISRERIRTLRTEVGVSGKGGRPRK